MLKSKQRLVAFLIVAAFASSSCTKTDYHYISLGGEMVVGEYGRSNLESVKFDNDMPIRYKLERENYTLIAETDLDAIDAAILFYVGNDTQNEVHISGEFSSVCFGQFLGQRFLTARNMDPNRLYFIWARSLVRECMDKPDLEKSAQVLLISFSDFSGAVIGVERIPFTIETNGLYIESNAWP